MKHYRVHDPDIPQNVVFFSKEKASQMFPKAEIEELMTIENYNLRFLDLSRFSFLEQTSILEKLNKLLQHERFDEFYLFLETNGIPVIDAVEKLEFKPCIKGYLKKIEDKFYHYNQIFHVIDLKTIDLDHLCEKHGGLEKIKHDYNDYERVLAELYVQRYL